MSSMCFCCYLFFINTVTEGRGAATGRDEERINMNECNQEKNAHKGQCHVPKNAVQAMKPQCSAWCNVCCYLKIAELNMTKWVQSWLLLFFIVTSGDHQIEIVRENHSRVCSFRTFYDPSLSLQHRLLVNLKAFDTQCCKKEMHKRTTRSLVILMELLKQDDDGAAASDGLARR